ncbi:fibronectin type III domain-containing protein [Fodinibius saliphilus]|uniref:fibronectin type III domain-containing protein n=1 Tax=Fodinibius saliphilus TaxID=1920650 RepID=UPI001108179F|nr:fibronectin type III domain-containing protein [Fodinibius saliphilus]
MKRKYLLPVLILALCGHLSLVSCSSSSTGPDNKDNTNTPSAPTNLSGLSGDQEIKLNWDSNSEDDLGGYNLYRSTSSFSEISGMDPVNGGSLISNATFTDNKLENGTTYYYRLTAVNNDGEESNLSTELEITPFSNPPDRP